jgi:hypothetical protein
MARPKTAKRWSFLLDTLGTLGFIIVSLYGGRIASGVVLISLDLAGIYVEWKGYGIEGKVSSAVKGLIIAEGVLRSLSHFTSIGVGIATIATSPSKGFQLAMAIASAVVSSASALSKYLIE